MGTSRQPAIIMCDEESKPAIVLDNGTGMIKAGISGEDAPKVTFASCVGYPKHKTALIGTQKDYFVGEEAQQKRGILQLRYPLEHGVVQNWEMVTVHNQMIRAPELLFTPAIGGKELPGMHELVKQTVGDCDMDVRRDLYHSVVMSGGTTMYQNMPERLQEELKKLVPEATQVKVIAPPERMISVWIGGSILASLSTFERMWINRESNAEAQPPIMGYEEAGPRIVHQMCST